MKKLLIIGVNTRPIVNSALKLDFEIYSSSYYATYDFEKPLNEIHILNQNIGESCGDFTEKYNPKDLLNISKDFLEIVDYIILCSGISSSDFTGNYKKYKKKIIGNKNVVNIEDKFKFYQHVKNKFLTPETFKLKDINEASEIIENDIDKSYILKPLNGTGGYNVNFVNNDSFNQFKDMMRSDENINNLNNETSKNNSLILQECIKGINVSSSVLSSNKEAKTIINSRLLTLNDYGQKNSFIYSGNIIPLDLKSLSTLNNFNLPQDEIGIDNLNEDMNLISENLIKDLNLIGSTGVDMILSYDVESKNILENDIYIIEVNPRIQGTYECVEELLKINLLNAHILACKGEIIETPKFKGYSMKKIIYSKNRVCVGNLSLDNVYDVPYPNVIIENNQPLVTLINRDNNLKKVLKTIDITESYVNNNIENI